MVQIDISRVHPKMGSPELPWPARKTAQAAGWDCHAAIDEPLELWPGLLAKVPLGFALALPEGWEGQVRPRSGLASRGIIMPNSPGTVDADYRGEVSALLCFLPQAKPTGSPPLNFPPPANDPKAMYVFERDALALQAGHNLIDPAPFIIRPGDRICQLVIAAVPDVAWHPVPRAALTPTARGEGGFGSTGRAG